MQSKLSIPVRIGIGFALAGLALSVIGILRGNVPSNPASIAVALLIGGGVWFLVAWAVATAAVDVERDITELESGKEANMEIGMETGTAPEM